MNGCLAQQLRACVLGCGACSVVFGGSFLLCEVATSRCAYTDAKVLRCSNTGQEREVTRKVAMIDYDEEDGSLRIHFRNVDHTAG